MSDEALEPGALPARRLTADEFLRLRDINVLGGRGPELIDGQIRFGGFPYGSAARR
jgi:hypothetical protein